MNMPIALSYSRLSDYEQCPLKFKQKYIDKSYPDDSDNPAFVKGNQIHKQLEDYVVWKGADDGAKPTLSTHTLKASQLVDSLHTACNGRIFPEKQIAVDHNWELCDWFDKPDVVKYRAIIDCLVFFGNTEILAIDWKSGKVREYEDSPTSQLRLTSTILFNLYPKVQTITTAYVFVEHTKTVKVKFERPELEALQKPFDKAYIQVQEETEWKPKKNQWCNWCKTPDCPIKRK